MDTLEILTLLIGFFGIVNIFALTTMVDKLSEIKDAIRERKSKDE